MRLLTALRTESADFALGSRFLGEAPGIPLSRLLMLRAAILFTNLLHGAQLTDTHNGLRAMTRAGMKSLHLTLNRMAHASEIIDQILESGLRYTEVPVRITYTERSLNAGQKSTDALRLGLQVLIERMTR